MIAHLGRAIAFQEILRTIWARDETIDAETAEDGTGGTHGAKLSHQPVSNVHRKELGAADPADLRVDHHEVLRGALSDSSTHTSPLLLQLRTSARSIPTGPVPGLVQADAPIGKQLRR